MTRQREQERQTKQKTNNQPKAEQPARTNLNEAQEGGAHLGEVGLALRRGDEVVHGPVHGHGLPVSVVAYPGLELVEAAHHLRHVHPDAFFQLHVHLDGRNGFNT